MATPRPRVRFTAAEYLGLVAAVTQLEAQLQDDPVRYGADARAADRALAKVRASLSEADLRAIAKRLSPRQ